MIRPGWTATSAFYGFFFLAMGAHLPFWPLWLGDWGLSEAEIGAFASAAVAIRVVFGLALPWAADRFAAPRRLLAGMAGLSALLYLSHLWIDDRATLFAATLAVAIVGAGIMPISDALSLRAAQKGGFHYAPARSVGSAAFVVANILCGLAIGVWGSEAALWWIALSFLPLIALGRWHPGGAGAAIGRPKLAEAARLARAPAFLLAMVAAAAAQGGHAVLYTYGSVHWRAMGLGGDMIGALWAFGVVVEVAVMAIWGQALINRLGAAGALVLAGVAGVFRWWAMTLDPGLVWLWPLQALHGLTFTAAHLGIIAFVQAATPARLAATGQGLTGSLATGTALALGGFLSAWAYPIAGAGAFWIAFGFAALGLVAALALRRFWDGGEVAVAGVTR